MAWTEQQNEAIIRRDCGLIVSAAAGSGKTSVLVERLLRILMDDNPKHCVPADQKEYLIDALEKNGVSYDYVEFPHSNHLLYGDLDKMQTFMDLSLEYCKKYFQ